MRPGSIVGQMNHYLNTLKPRTGERVCLDHEDKGVSLADLESAVQYLQGDDRDLQITIYSGNVIKEQLAGGKVSEILADTSLWIAQYTNAASPSWPTQVWPQWSLWQYSDTGSVPGISGNVDVNRFNGSDDNCSKWLGPVGEPAPEPMPEPYVMPIGLSLPAGTQYEISVNGIAVVRGGAS
jgi:lysozyme